MANFYENRRESNRQTIKVLNRLASDRIQNIWAERFKNNSNKFDYHQEGGR